MARQRAEVLTPWTEAFYPDPETGEVASDRFPLVTDEYTLAKWTDITGQPAANIVPQPNLVSILVEADETVIEQIAADSHFYVLWEEYV